MKLTLDWLKQHLDTSASLDEITTALTAVGLEVDGVEDRAKAFAPFFVAKVESATRHPDADRLQVLMVDTGSEKLQVVCGAPNARAGMKGVFAPAGSYIPGTGITLKKGVIRGQESNGMMVSEREMGLSDAHEGIIEVADDVAIGTKFADLYRLNDPVIEIGLTPNRADCAGIRGIARDLAAAGLGTLKPINETPVTGTFKNPIGVTLDFNADSKHHCPLFLGRYIRGVKNGPSPQWLQDRLKAVGLRPISALVDITNLMTLDMNRPLHVFDADKLKGGIVVRSAKAGETLDALNDKSYTLDDGMVVVCDESGVLGLGGVIGGTSTGVADETVNVYVEAAYFDPNRTARTGRALQINSDARYRFERGIDPEFTVIGMEIATRLIMEICGGEASDVITAGSVPEWKRTIAYDPALTKKLTGVDIAVDQQIKTLTALGFAVSGTAPSLSIIPPAWRGDIEGRADIVEEVLRIYGLDNMPAISLTKTTTVTHSADTPNVTRMRKSRIALAARGMDEAVTWSFMDRTVADAFGVNDNGQAALLTLANPISSELDTMRPSILPNLIQAASRNRARGFADCALFEVGPIFRSAKVEGQAIVASGMRAGNAAPRHWSGPHASRAMDAFDAKADACAVLDACGFVSSNAQITRDAPGYYHPGRSGTLRLGKVILAHFGEIHPAVLDQLDVKGPVVGFEVFLDAIPQPKNKSAAKPLLTLSPFQPLSRDFAFIVTANTEADVIIRAAKSADKNLISDIQVFDVYQGKGVEDGHKSVAIAVTLQPTDKTLTDADIEDISAKIIKGVTEKTGGKLRA